MISFRDVLVGLWIAAVTIAAFGILPAAALGRPARHGGWWPICLAGAAWSTLATIVLVPVLAALHLLNWATALIVPLVWPVSLWLYRHRGAPSGAFRAMCRDLTLRVLTWQWPARSSPLRLPAMRIIAASCGIVVLYALAARQLRFASPDDYDTLAEVRALLAGGRWVTDPLASIAAIITRLAAVDPMQAVRFLAPITWPGALIARTFHAPSSNAAFAWSALLATVALASESVRATHRRAPWHATAACTVALLAFSVLDAGAREGAGYVEYDAAPRQVLAIARAFADEDWRIVAPMEQRVEVPDPRHFLSLNDFVRRFADRTADSRFRFDVGGRDLFVFIEKTPLPIDPATTVTSARYAGSVDPYWLPNARARLERRALRLCEVYRRAHAGVTVYYEDLNLRVYRIQH
jgi:hypothetical protein